MTRHEQKQFMEESIYFGSLQSRSRNGREGKSNWSRKLSDRVFIHTQKAQRANWKWARYKHSKPAPVTYLLQRDFDTFPNCGINWGAKFRYLNPQGRLLIQVSTDMCN